MNHVNFYKFFFYSSMFASFASPSSARDRIYKILLQRIKHSPNSPVDAPSTNSSVSLSYKWLESIPFFKEKHSNYISKSFQNSFFKTRNLSIILRRKSHSSLKSMPTYRRNEHSPKRSYKNQPKQEFLCIPFPILILSSLASRLNLLKMVED